MNTKTAEPMTIDAEVEVTKEPVAQPPAVAETRAPASIGEEGTLLQVIANAARDPNCDVEKMEHLLKMHERMEDRQHERAYNKAMSRAQSQMEMVSQDASNPQTSSKYASYAALDKALRPIYVKAGFALSFDTADGAPENYVRVTCRVSHKDGHCDHPHIDMPADGKGAKGGSVMTKTHATMSAITYGRRGLLKMIFNIAEGKADDDGNAAGDTAGNNGMITQEQVDDLTQTAETLGVDQERLCRFFEISSLEAVPASHLNKVKTTILQMGQKAAAVKAGSNA